jgi:high-affinity K+ transport system ATPase subunit B
MKQLWKNFYQSNAFLITEVNNFEITNYMNLNFQMQIVLNFLVFNAFFIIKLPYIGLAQKCVIKSISNIGYELFSSNFMQI